MLLFRCLEWQPNDALQRRTQRSLRLSITTALTRVRWKRLFAVSCGSDCATPTRQFCCCPIQLKLVASPSIHVDGTVTTSVIAPSHNVSHMSTIAATVVTPTILGASRLGRGGFGQITPRCSFVARAGEHGNTGQQSGQHYCYQGSFHLPVSL
jgi:hypothetical protein